MSDPELYRTHAKPLPPLPRAPLQRPLVSQVPNGTPISPEPVLTLADHAPDDRLENEEGASSDSEEDSDRFFDFALLSRIAVKLRAKARQEEHVKGGILYPHSMTGKDIVASARYESLLVFV